MLLLFLLACHPVFFESETGFLSLNFFVRVFLDICCCCLSSDSLLLLQILCLFFSWLRVLFQVEEFCLHGTYWMWCMLPLSLPWPVAGIFLYLHPVCCRWHPVLIVVLFFFSTSLCLVEVFQALCHVIFDVLNLSSEFSDYFPAEFSVLF